MTSPTVAAAEDEQMSTWDWNIADVFDVHARRRGNSPAIIQGKRVRPWAEFEARAADLAATLFDCGVEPGDKVALYLFNDIAVLEFAYACYRSATAPITTNQRYGSAELLEMWRDVEPAAVVFHRTLAEAVDAVRRNLPSVRAWICVDDQGMEPPDWAVPSVAAHGRAIDKRPQRSGDDLLFFFTGGTTGSAKGVMWRHGDIIPMWCGTHGARLLDASGPADVVDAMAPHAGVTLVAPSLMHPMGWVIAHIELLTGGTVLLLEGRAFDAHELLDTIERHRAERLVLVGDAFVVPLVDALGDQPGRWDLTSLREIKSGGMLLSDTARTRLLDLLPPSVVLSDGLGSTETPFLGFSESRRDSLAEAGLFTPYHGVVVLDDEDRVLGRDAPGIGRLARTGYLPTGYYNDPASTAKTFVTIDGRRYGITGDYVRLEPDGRIRLLGRGSSCINTGGEKVYAEEVEAEIRNLDGITDVVVLGVPDDRFGQQVAALVEVEPGYDLHIDWLRSALRPRLAGFKLPRVLFTHIPLERDPRTGKVNLRALRAQAVQQMADQGDGRPSARA